jgi:hypothetical protein
MEPVQITYEQVISKLETRLGALVMQLEHELAIKEAEIQVKNERIQYLESLVKPTELIRNAEEGGVNDNASNIR